MSLPYNRNWEMSFSHCWQDEYVGFIGDIAKNVFEWGRVNKVRHDIYADPTMNFFHVSFDRPFANTVYDGYFDIDCCNYYRYFVWTSDFLCEYLYFGESVETYNTNTIDFKGSLLDCLLYDIDN